MHRAVPEGTYLHARRWSQTWTPEEDRRLWDGSTRAVAAALGRTQRAVEYRRRVVKQQRLKGSDD